MKSFVKRSKCRGATPDTQKASFRSIHVLVAGSDRLGNVLVVRGIPSGISSTFTSIDTGEDAPRIWLPGLIRDAHEASRGACGYCRVHTKLECCHVSS